MRREANAAGSGNGGKRNGSESGGNGGAGNGGAGDNGGSDSPLFAADSLFLSPALAGRLGLATGDFVAVTTAGAEAVLRVAGEVPGAEPRQELAVLDIGTLQWRLHWLGRLSRIDLLWAENIDAQAARARLLKALGTGIVIGDPTQGAERSSNLSRAYRVNLGILSLVASFTGAFLVWSSLALAVSKQQRQLALLGMLGLPRRSLSQAVLMAGLLIGAIGAVLGVLLGIALARLLVELVGADLGAGYFAGRGYELQIDALALLSHAALGLLVALAGAWFPAREAARLSWIDALRGRSPPASRSRQAQALTLTLIGTLLLTLPAVDGLPIPAYLAIGCWLLAGIQLTAAWIRAISRLLTRHEALWARWPTVWLAWARFLSDRIDARHSARVAAGVVASFALACAMAIMVMSFRGSVADWLTKVLPADLYARAGERAGVGLIDAAAQTRIAGWPGVQRVQFMRSTKIALDPTLPDLTVIARPLQGTAIGNRSAGGNLPATSNLSAADELPITGALRTAPAGTIAVYASEAAAALHGWQVGMEFQLPAIAPAQRFFLAGIWRDYARQTGAIVIDLETYRALTADRSINEVAIWLADAASPEATLEKAASDPDAVVAGLQWRSASDLRRLSLRIFDRSFAMTYVLEAIAILIALAGVSAGFSTQALSRIRELSMTRLLGMTRRNLLTQLAIEAAIVISISVLWAMAIGTAIAGILVWRVNPQSFHWTMDLRWPALELIAVGLTLVVLGTAAAVISAWRVTRAGALTSLKEDW